MTDPSPTAKKQTDALMDIILGALDRAEARAEKAEAANKELVEALAPFADSAAAYDPPKSDDHEEAFATRFSIGLLRRARAALAAARKARLINTPATNMRRVWSRYRRERFVGGGEYPND